MNGTRKRNYKVGQMELVEGEYAKDDRDGVWYCKPPGMKGVGSLRNHTVIEHEDGRITVSPSILIAGEGGQWHGYLEKGVWREA